jgi:hypothetical protein
VDYSHRQREHVCVAAFSSPLVTSPPEAFSDSSSRHVEVMWKGLPFVLVFLFTCPSRPLTSRMDSTSPSPASPGKPIVESQGKLPIGILEVRVHGATDLVGPYTKTKTTPNSLKYTAMNPLVKVCALALRPLPRSETRLSARQRRRRMRTYGDTSGRFIQAYAHRYGGWSEVSDGWWIIASSLAGGSRWRYAGCDSPTHVSTQLRVVTRESRLWLPCI